LSDCRPDLTSTFGLCRTASDVVARLGVKRSRVQVPAARLTNRQVSAVRSRRVRSSLAGDNHRGEWLLASRPGGHVPGQRNKPEYQPRCRSLRPSHGRGREARRDNQRQGCLHRPV